MSIWFSDPNLDAMNQAGEKSMVGRLGIRFTEKGVDFIRATMPVSRHTQQPFGVLHGGASAALAETVASYAALHCIDQKRYLVAGLELNINHIRSVSGGQVVATGKPLHVGRTTHVWEVMIRDEQERLVAASRLTVAVVPRS